MRLAFLSLLLLSWNCNVAIATPTREQIIQQIRTRLDEQQVQLDDALAHLKDSRESADTLLGELTSAQTQMNKVGQERDEWKAAYEKQAIALANARKHVSYLITTLTLITVAIGGYAVAKFYFHLPI